MIDSPGLAPMDFLASEEAKSLVCGVQADWCGREGRSAFVRQIQAALRSVRMEVVL